MILLCLILDVGNWREGGGRGAMLQTSPNKDAQSPAASGAESLTETPPSGLPTAGVGPGSGGVDSPGGPPMGGVGLGGPAGIPGMRPGMQGPMGPGHHMGPPPYSLPPGYRGMMPHYVSSCCSMLCVGFAYFYA